MQTKIEKSEPRNELLIDLFPPSGTSDYFPIDMKCRNWLFQIWKQVSEECGYDEYDAPIIEHSNLYTCKNSGNDGILSEMYAFEKGNIKLALRPEMTPSFARMILSCISSEILPIKWYSIPQCWRFENVSKGRRREFYQWNVDILGGENTKSEIEIFSILVKFFKRVGLTSDNIELRVSNRMILQKIFNKMGVTDEKILFTLFNIVDKLEKLTKIELADQIKNEIGLTDENIQLIFEILKVKDINLLKNSSMFNSFLNENDEILNEMITLFDMADKIGIKDWLKFDLSIVRGLSYYTGMVFEGFFKKNNIGDPPKRAICGGGEYNNLLKTYGYKSSIKSCGFGMGNCVILECLSELNLLPIFTINKDYIVVPFNDDFYCDAIFVADKLRGKGKSVDVYMKKGKIKNAYSYADRKGVKFVVFIAPTEWKENKIVVKDMRRTDEMIVSENKQITISLDKYLDQLK